MGLRLAIAGIALVALVAFLSNIKERGRQEGRQEVVSASLEAGRQANVKNEKVRRNAAAPGAFERMLKDGATCRDCGGKPLP